MTGVYQSVLRKMKQYAIFTCNWLNGINLVFFFSITIIWYRQFIYGLKMILHHLLCNEKKCIQSTDYSSVLNFAY